MSSEMTDEQISGLVDQVLQSSHYQQFRNLKAHCENGRVTIQGCLATYYLKQVAQTAILAVAGVREIDNGVEVHHP